MLYAKIDTASSGNTTLVAAVAGRRVRVVGYVLYAGGTVNVKFTDGAGGTALTGAFPFKDQGGVMAPMAPEDRIEQKGHFEGGVNTALVLNLDATVQVSGHLAYTLVL